MKEHPGLFDRLLSSGMIRRWARMARRASETDIAELRRQRKEARRLKQHVDHLIHVAESRLALPLIGSQSFPRPHDADWAWRPEIWTGPLPVPGLSSVQSKSPLGREAQLFHDCRFSELTLRQLRNRREEDLAPFGLRLDVFRFDGSTCPRRPPTGWSGGT